MPLPTLSPQLYTILSALIEERTGIHFAPHDNEILTSKITSHARDAGFDSILDYYYFLRYDDSDGAATKALTEAIVVGETYFFRELEPLKLIANELVPELLAAKPKVNILSAASATGEEAYTLAMLLDARGVLDSTRITAADISEKALERARTGVYRKRALRSPPPAFAERYLKIGGDDLRVDLDLGRAIEWVQVNLVDRTAIGKLPQFDVILCRNVLIYFREATMVSVIQGLAEKLANDGYLFIGISESLLRLETPFTCEERSGVFLYRKTGPKR